MELRIERTPDRYQDSDLWADDLDQLEELGANLAPVAEAVQHFRDAHDRRRHTLTNATTDRTSPRGIINEAARAYADGAIGEDDLKAAATTAALVKGNELGEAYSTAAAILNTRARKALTAEGDKWITEVMRPIVDHLVSLIIADIPAPVRERIDPRDPTAELLLGGYPTAQEAYGDLEAVWSLAARWRLAHIIPATTRDQTAWHYAASLGERGRTFDGLAGLVHHHRKGHAPGIYTETEVADTEAANPSRPVTASDRAAALAAAQRGL